MGTRIDSRTENEKDEAKIRRAADLLTRFQCSKARKGLMSNGLGDHTDESIIEQMKKKHPLRKKDIAPLSDEELSITQGHQLRCTEKKNHATQT